MQLVGSLLAVFVAGAVPYWQKWRTDRENFNRARQCLMMLCGMIESMRLIAMAAGGAPRRTDGWGANLAAMFDEVRPPQMSLGQLAIWRAARATVSELGELSLAIREGRIADENVLPVLDGLMHASKRLLEGFGEKAEREPAIK